MTETTTQRPRARERRADRSVLLCGACQHFRPAPRPRDPGLCTKVNARTLPQSAGCEKFRKASQ